MLKRFGRLLLTLVISFVIFGAGYITCLEATYSTESRISNMLWGQGLAAIKIEGADTSTPHFKAVVRDAPWCIVTGAQSHSSERWMLFGYSSDTLNSNERDWPPKGTVMTELIEQQPDICRKEH